MDVQSIVMGGADISAPGLSVPLRMLPAVGLALGLLTLVVEVALARMSCPCMHPVTEALRVAVMIIGSQKAPDGPSTLAIF